MLTFRNKLSFYGEKFLALVESPSPKTSHHPSLGASHTEWNVRIHDEDLSTGYLMAKGLCSVEITILYRLEMLLTVEQIVWHYGEVEGTGKCSTASYSEVLRHTVPVETKGQR
jgi:hypothetical protein